MFIHFLFYEINHRVEQVGYLAESYHVVVDKVEFFSVADIIFFLISCSIDMIAHNAHIAEMEMMEFLDECIMVSFDVDYFHSFFHALYNIVHDLRLFLCPLS